MRGIRALAGLLLVLAATPSCVPLPGGATLSRKRVLAKDPPATLVADDATVCRVGPDRFENTGVGEWVSCGWREPDGGSPAIGCRRLRWPAPSAKTTRAQAVGLATRLYGNSRDHLGWQFPVAACDHLTTTTAVEAPVTVANLIYAQFATIGDCMEQDVALSDCWPNGRIDQLFQTAREP